MNPQSISTGRVLAIACLLSLALPLWIGAQERKPASADSVPQHRIAEVVVAVSRTEGAKYSLPRQIDVVSRAEIDRTAARDVAELLKKRANVDVIQFPGLLAGVGIRGFRPQFSGLNQRTLVLLDGRPAGATNLALLNLTDVERVEVLRGPASALYGSAAMGGVVNVVTRSSTGPLRSTARLAYGSWDTREAQLSTGGLVTQNLDLDLAVSILEQGRDYRVGGGNLLRGWFGEEVVVRTFPDGSTEESAELGDGEVRPFSQYGTRSGSLRLGYQLAPEWRVNARAEHLDAERVQNPGDMFASWGDSRSLKDVARSSGDLTAAGSIDRHDFTLRLYASRETAANYNQPEPLESQPQFVSFDSRNRWHGMQLQDAVAFGDHSVIAGLDYTVAESTSDRFAPGDQPIAPWEPDSRTAARSAFAEARIRSPDQRLTLTVGGRLDGIGFEVRATELADGDPAVHAIAAGNKESFTVFNPSVGAQYGHPSGLRLHGSGGRAFLAPSAFNVAGYVERRAPSGTVMLTRGNPDLRPEHSFTWDAGVGLVRPAAGLEADVTYFRTRVSDRITTQHATPPAGSRTPAGDSIAGITTFGNADEASMQGVEWRVAMDIAPARTQRSALRIFAGATHIFEAEEVVSGAERPVRNVAERTINTGLELDRSGWFNTRLTGRYVGQRTDDDWNSWPAAVIRYPAFLTLDWSGEVRLAARIRLGLLVSNLTDENFYEVRGYPLAGRALRLQLAAEF